MPTEKDSTAQALTAHLQRMSDSVEQLSARIARLGKLLNIDLQNENEIDRLLDLDSDAPGGHERRLSARPIAGPERRRVCQLEELRALLVLRYRLSHIYVKRVGVQVTRHILVEAQDQLERGGFKPGAAGADVRSLFDGF